MNEETLESQCKKAGHGAKGKVTEFIIHFESIQTSESIYQRTLEGYHREKLNIYFFSYLNFNFVIFTVELIKEFTKKHTHTHTQKTSTSLNSEEAV